MSNVKPLRIFLADDDDDDTFLFQEALEQIPLDTELTIAGNGMELMEILNDGADEPDIIFLDMNMPVKNGLECLEEVRTSQRFRNVPIVILSTSIAQYLWESAYKGGANLYVQKPTNFDDLVEIIKKCLLQDPGSKWISDMEQFLIKN